MIEPIEQCVCVSADIRGIVAEGGFTSITDFRGADELAGISYTHT